MLSKSILEQLIITPKNTGVVHGGDINKAYCIETGTERYFLKINNAGLYPQMFVREARGLDILRAHTPLKVPVVIQTGTDGENQFLLLEWLEKEKTKLPAPYQFGQGIADLHLNSQPDYGFPENNYIGSLSQINTPTPGWPAFYANYRILPLVRLLRNKGLLSSADAVRADQFCRAIGTIFPEEKPALLHGDLWSGNYAGTTGGQTAVFDPAVYYGHREMDLAMTKLFGGFSNDFYAGYNDRYPLANGWINRLPYAQLYPLLVHVFLFEGPYVDDVRTILHQF